MTRKRVLLSAEIISIYILLPLVYAMGWLPIHEVILMVGGALIMAIVLYKDPAFDNRIFTRPGRWSWQHKMIRLFLVTAGAVAIQMFTAPGMMFYYPAQKTWLYVIIIILYPFVSVIPQEIVFRAFFYYRYKDLTNSRLLLVTLNSLLFGFAHIIYGNWIAPVSAFLISFFLSHTYQKSNSVKEVSIEHFLYGAMVYTIGLGYFFIRQQ